MIDLGAHAVFIIASYAFAVVALAALASWIVMDSRNLKATLAQLEASGVKRRSRRAATAPQSNERTS